MLLDRSRDEITRAKKSEIRQCELNRTRKLRELWRYTSFVDPRTPLSPRALSAEPSDNEVVDEQLDRFLDATDITKNRFFRDELLPLPLFSKTPLRDIPVDETITPASPPPIKPSLSAQTKDASNPAPPVHHKSPRPIATSLPPVPPSPNNNVAARPALQLEERKDATITGSPRSRQQTRTPTIQIPDSGLTQKNIKAQNRHPSVDLPLASCPDQRPQPPVHKEGARFEGIPTDKERRDDERTFSILGTHGGDLASSPSSTVGPYSAHTPRPAQHSPDTSPEQDTFGLDSSALGHSTEANVAQFKTDELLKRSTAPSAAGDQPQLQDERARSERASSSAHQVVEERAENNVNIGTTDQSVTSSTSPHLSLESRLRKQPTPPPDVDMQDAPGAEKTVGRHRTDKVIDVVPDGSVAHNALTPESGALHPLSRINLRNSKRTTQRRKKPKQSAVVFPQTTSDAYQNSMQLHSEDYAALKGASLDDRQDYLLGLFTHQAHLPPRSMPLEQLLTKGYKNVSTSNFSAWLRDWQDYRILKRVYHLQNANRWSLRQMEKAPEPVRPFTHGDHLLKEMKWARIDFREERKWKLSMARTLARWCAEWVDGDEEHRASLRIKTRTHKNSQFPDAMDLETMADGSLTEALVEDQSRPKDGGCTREDSAYGSPSAAALFSLGFDDVVLQIKHTPATDRLLHELPEYDQNQTSTEFSLTEPPILPVSKFITGKLITKTTGPPRKRSRYEFEQEDDYSDYSSKRPTPDHSRPSTPGRRLHHDELPPESTDVALFNYENKHVKDRLHASHVFRPPSEFGMPTVAFLAARLPSQWHWDEDQKLRSLVKEYSFNWSLIASELAMPSMFIAGAERRTPWECFERFVQLEGLPTDMSKTQYFRTWQGRQEEAHRIVTTNFQMAQQAQQQLARDGTQAGQANIPRKRTAQPYRVERRKNVRYLTLIDAMRKLAKKRESAAHKQQENAKAAAMRKAHEPPPPKTAVHTPQEFSKLKHQREQEAEKRESVRQQLHLQQMQAARQQQARAHQASGGSQNPNAPIRNGSNMANGNGAIGVNVNNGLHASNQASKIAQNRVQQAQAMMQGNIPNGGNIGAMGMGMGMNGMPQAQMQMPSQQQRLQQQQESLRLQMQQQRLSQQQQYQLQQQLNNTSNGHLGGSNMAMQNPAVLAAMAANKSAANGNGNLSINGASRMSGSPPMSMASPQTSQGRPLSSGHMPQINALINSIQQQHPEWTEAQVRGYANQQLKKRTEQAQQQLLQRQNAMNAAAGNAYQANGNVMTGNNGSPTNAQAQQAYVNNMMRNAGQSQTHPQAGSPNMGAVRPVSRSATPQNPQQLQQSPSMQQAQTARNGG